MEFKDRLKELRNDRNISAVDLAKNLNKSESAIRMWESGKTKPDADTLIELSNMLGCTTDYLLGLSDFKNDESRERYDKALSLLTNKFEEVPYWDREDFLWSLNHLLHGYKMSGYMAELNVLYSTTVKNMISNLESSIVYIRNSHNAFTSGERKEYPLFSTLSNIDHASNFLIKDILKFDERCKLIVLSYLNEYKDLSYQDAVETVSGLLRTMHINNGVKKDGEPNAEKDQH